MSGIELTQAEILDTLDDGSPNPEYPEDLRCKSGHLCPDGTRFFRVGGTALSKGRAGVYCEYCLIVANAIVRSRNERSR